MGAGRRGHPHGCEEGDRAGQAGTQADRAESAGSDGRRARGARRSVTRPEARRAVAGRDEGVRTRSIHRGSQDPEAACRTGPRFGARPRALRADAVPPGTVAGGGPRARGVPHAHRIRGAAPGAGGLLSRAAPVHRGRRAVEGAGCRFAERGCRDRGTHRGRRRARRTRARSTGRSGCWRPGRSRRNGCRCTTCGSRTRSPTSSSAPATSRERDRLFRKVADSDPDFADVGSRLRSLD